MCRVNPELIWPHIVAENPNNPTWDMVKPKWRRTYFGPLVDFPGMCPICRKKYDHRSKFPFGEGFERTQDSSSGLFGFKPKQVEDEEVDELAVFLGQTSLSRCHGWQGEPKDRRCESARWIAFSVKMLVVFLMFLFLWDREKQRGIQMYQDSVRADGN
ncbi:Protein of unknown function [Pyronema omphalodes CBS 100304]|uniref:Uncharacterized protein n=1 Tax=Pyronema omphalodes (strain CBS 100304) TaxID=1076935 RepID=U4KUE3_PYROM|nr:Protein of unknown function [Pyronema omphalodes CBS 100304]